MLLQVRGLSLQVKNQYYTSLLLFFIFVIIYSQILFTLPYHTDAAKVNTFETTIISDPLSDYKQNIFVNDIVSLESLNDISAAKVICYLHLKTVQVQLDIDFVGVSATKIPSDAYTNAITLERITVLGEIRNVQVVESDVNILLHTLVTTVNGTMIQFELTASIPVGVTRNVKITYIQDTSTLVTNFNYQFGIYWMRRIGSHAVNILCDAEISLLSCNPSPHTISTIGDKLVLSWLEVNPFDFFSNITYTRKILIDNLIITPNEWNIGRIKTSHAHLEKIFEVINNENTQLDGTIITPEWISVNVSEWSLSVGEKMFLEVTIDISKARNMACNVSFQCSFASFPVNIQITGEVRDQISLSNLMLIILLSLLIVATISATIVFVSRRKRISATRPIVSSESEKEDIPLNEKIDMDKWKEILTEKEFIIFKQIVQSQELTQTALVQQTSLSKSTVSRAVGRLVVKGLVKKTKYGMSNIISVNEEFFKNS